MAEGLRKYTKVAEAITALATLVLFALGHLHFECVLVRT